MSRIRTIKPEFFTSEDVVSLSPLARLLYIALWCEADRAGRLEWKPQTFKFRYLPADGCDIEALCSELLKRGVVRLYGINLAFIPKFGQHQQINNRETESKLPDPSHVSDASGTRQARVQGATLEEGKGREGNTIVSLADASDSPPAGGPGDESSDETSPEDSIPDCPQQGIVRLYHEVLPGLPPVNEWTAQNAENLRTRWRSAPDRQDVAWWRGFFEYVRKCPFLMGEKTDFQASLGWLVKAGNFAKVLNGQYEERKAAA